MVLCLHITTCFWYSTLDIFILPRLELAGFLSSLQPHYYDYWQTSTQLTFSVDTGDPILNPIVCTEIKIHRTISPVSRYLNVLKRLISMYPFCPQIICMCVLYDNWFPFWHENSIWATWNWSYSTFWPFYAYELEN